MKKCFCYSDICTCEKNSDANDDEDDNNDYFTQELELYLLGKRDFIKLQSE